MTPAAVYLGLGTNLGDRVQNLERALAGLAAFSRVVGRSSVYETEPWGLADQPNFYNMVVQVETDLEPEALLVRTKALEQRLGRVPGGVRNGPRVIDVDILLYGDRQVQAPGLVIPHPALSERAFVLVPLAEIAPGLIIPPTGIPAARHLERVGSAGVRRLDLSLTLRPRRLEWGKRTYVMGILNATPDSFSGDGLYAGGKPLDDALQQARTFIADGADILDIGGESTRPGSQPVSSAQEQERVLPLIEAIRRESDVLVSIDTYKAEVARAALECGADWINDVWACRADPEMAGVAAAYQAVLVLMHNRSRPAEIDLQLRLGGMYLGAEYRDLLQDVGLELLASADHALSAGVPREDILLDPGIGFGKSIPQNMQLINHLDRICDLGYPVLLGPSRKSFIGFTLDLPPGERVEGTAAAVAVGILRGASVVRVHDVRQMVRVARMTDAILHSG